MKNTTTQSFVPIKEIRDGVIVRNDGVLCSIILVSSMNFNLKSTVEREAILYQFQSFLNSLEVGVQVVIQSRRLNIKPYLEFLGTIYDKQQNELLRLQTKEYITFIQEFTEKNEIMTKQFFVVITYSPIDVHKKGNFFLGADSEKKERQFEENQGQLLQRISFVQNNIRSLGLRAVQLGTEEVTELLYQIFNPGDTQTPPSL